MILSYRDKRTKDFAEGSRVRDFESFRRQAEKRLDILDAATSLADPGSHIVDRNHAPHVPPPLMRVTHWNFA